MPVDQRTFTWPWRWRWRRRWQRRWRWRWRRRRAARKIVNEQSRKSATLSLAGVAAARDARALCFGPRPHCDARLAEVSILAAEAGGSVYDSGDGLSGSKASTGARFERQRSACRRRWCTREHRARFWRFPITDIVATWVAWLGTLGTGGGGQDRLLARMNITRISLSLDITVTLRKLTLRMVHVYGSAVGR